VRGIRYRAAIFQPCKRPLLTRNHALRRFFVILFGEHRFRIVQPLRRVKPVQTPAQV
jgi:hypothetical protein